MKRRTATPRGVEKLSFGGTSKSSRREPRRDERRENQRGKKKEMMREETMKYERVPSRVFLKIFLFPMLLPMKDADASERANEIIEAIAISFEKREMMRREEDRKYIWAPGDFLSFSLASFSKPNSHPFFILRISRRRDMRREMKMSFMSAAFPRIS
ncbi:MAG: hypothetical protein PWR13_463 [Archaeoglobi archaeon]|nr:hypothetical protein [Archaeoglobi archaeon]